MPQIAEVIVDISHSEVDRVFDYLVDEQLNIVPGDRVYVPFGNQRRLEGYVLGLKNETQVPADKLKWVLGKPDSLTVLTPDLVELATWIKGKYHCHMADAIKLMLPPLSKKKMISQKSKKIIRLLRPVEEIYPLLRANSTKARAVLEYLSEHEEADKHLLVNLFENLDSPLKMMTEKGWIEQYDERVSRQPYLELGRERDTALNPNDGQSRAITSIEEAINGAGGRFLIRGVTGSGKTEVYLQSIQYALDKGLSAIVLVPEISLTPQTVARFRARFGQRVAVLHSALSMGERADEWYRIISGEADVVVGARSAVFAPVKKLGLIIVDEEHENSYRSDMTPKYDAIEVAERRVSQGGVLVLGSATPTVERYDQAKKGHYTLLTMEKRINDKPLPNVELVDMRKEFQYGNRSIFSQQLYSGIEQALANGGQVILFLNRRGYSTFVMCRECGHVMGCDHCDSKLTYHQHTGRLVCHYCLTDYQVPQTCPECGSKYIKYFGTGTERIEEEIRKQFPQARPVRMDMDTVSAKDSHMNILARFGSGECNVLIGTQMVTKGLDFPHVEMVGVIAADIGLFMPDYRASERTFQLITQVAGRAGRKDRDGRVVVQTYSPDHYAVSLAARHDYEGFYATEIEMRRRGCYPPFGDMIRAVYSGESDEETRNCCEAAKRELAPYLAERQVIYFDSMRAPMGKLKGVYRWQIILRLYRDEQAEELIGKFIQVCESKKGRDTYVSIDMNPVNMM